MPTEIKEHIYKYAICRKFQTPYRTPVSSRDWHYVRLQALYLTDLKIPVEMMPRSGSRCLDSRLPAMYLTSKAEYKIAVPVLIREAIFHMSRLQHAEMLAGYMDDLERVEVMGGKAIRRVEITYDGTSPVAEVGQMLKQLTRYKGLKEVIILIPLEELDFTITVVGILTLLTRDPGISADDIISKFQLEEVLKYDGLQRLVLVAIVSIYDTMLRMPAYYGHIGDRLWLAGLKAVARSLEAKKRGIEVAVEFLPIEILRSVSWEGSAWDDCSGRRKSL
jgi:hypothetical protein